MASFEIDEAGLLQLLQDLIQIESVNPALDSSGRGEAGIGAFIFQRLKDSGLQVEIQPVADSRVNIIARLKGAGSGKCLMLNGHTDTVSLRGMEIAPLEPEYREGKVFGRGSLDMKAGLAAMIVAAEAVLAAETKLKGDVLLSFVADEEHASLGTERLVQEYTADAVIICEPTNLDICIAHKGFSWVNLEVFGKAAHGSRFDEGVDAIVKAGKFLSKLEEFADQVLGKKKHPLLGPPSVHASLINGGLGLSTYPDYCKVQLERRTLPGESPESVKTELEELIAELSRADSKFKAAAEVFFSRYPVEISEEEEIVQTLTRAGESVLGKKPQYIGVGGWLDSGIFAAGGIPAISFGPKGEGLHAAVEYVEFDSVITTAQVLAQTIVDFCG
jgi:acetylornithine deacetylase